MSLPGDWIHDVDYHHLGLAGVQIMDLGGRAIFITPAKIKGDNVKYPWEERFMTRAEIHAVHALCPLDDRLKDGRPYRIWVNRVHRVGSGSGSLIIALPEDWIYRQTRDKKIPDFVRGKISKEGHLVVQLDGVEPDLGPSPAL